MRDTSYETPTHCTKFCNGEMLPVLGGPIDGDSKPVPVMFGAIVPTFLCVGLAHYQLLEHERIWRFSFTASRDW